MLYDIFFSPVESAIAATRHYTQPAAALIPPGSCGIPASKLWFALSQAPIAIVNDAIFAALSSIEYVPEPTPEIEPKPVKVSKSKAVKENLYGKAINVLADAIVLGEPVPEPPAPTPTEPNDVPFPEMSQEINPEPPQSKKPKTLEEYVDLDLNSEKPVEELGNGGFWKASVDRPQIGIGWKIYRTKSDARFHGKQAELWAVDWRVVKLDTGWKLQAAYIERDRWEKVVSGVLPPRRSTEKPKRERLTEAMQSLKRQFELEPIGELREKYRRALSAGFRSSFEVSTISRHHLVKALVEAAEWEFS